MSVSDILRQLAHCEGQIAERLPYSDGWRNQYAKDVAWLLAEFRAQVLPDDTVCTCLDETGERHVRKYERCDRCGSFMRAGGREGEQ